MGKKARHEARNLYWEKFAEKIEKIYQEILEEKMRGIIFRESRKKSNLCKEALHSHIK